MKEYYSHGKLLLSGEYAVLDGALALGLPTKFGQSLQVDTLAEEKIVWKSLDHNDQIWFQALFKIEQGILFPEEMETNVHDEIATTLFETLSAAQRLNPNFLARKEGYSITTKMDFPKEWGLGSSSTFINNIAQWAQVDAFRLLWNSFGGSGYDIACARNSTPIMYQLQNGKPLVCPVDFDPPFKDRLYFVYLNKKKNSRKGIAHFKDLIFDRQLLASKVSSITKQIAAATNIGEFEELLLLHETLLSATLGMPRVPQDLFPDYTLGVLKSLGAWGGDFMLATAKENPTAYFHQKGFTTVLSFSDMIFSGST